MADTLTFSIRCDDGVIRTIKMHLGEPDKLLDCYNVTISKEFLEDIVDMYHANRYHGIVDMKISKEE